MAGKTLSGIGDPEDESAPFEAADAADSGGDPNGHYSGPTVVDDVKVEAGLKKLRSLDTPATLIGMGMPDISTLESGPTIVAESGPTITLDSAPIVTLDSGPVTVTPEVKGDAPRETSLGRSVVGPVAGQQTTQPFDDRHLRATMFGHSVHIPDLDLALSRDRTPAPQSLAVIERGAPTAQKSPAVYFPSQPPHSSQGLHPAEPPRAPLPPRGPDPARVSQRFYNTPVDLQPISSRKRLATRLATAVVAIAALVGAALVWVRTTTDDPDPPSRAVPSARASQPSVPVTPVVPSAPTTAPPAAAMPGNPVAPPAFPPSATNPSTRLSAPTVHPAASGTLQATEKPAKSPAKANAAKAARTDDDSDDEEVAAKPAPSHHSHAAASATPRPERHHAAKDSAKTDDDATPVKPARTGKKSLEEDPDATMAPSIE